MVGSQRRNGRSRGEWPWARLRHSRRWERARLRRFVQCLSSDLLETRSQAASGRRRAVGVEGVVMGGGWWAGKELLQGKREGARRQAQPGAVGLGKALSARDIRR